MRSTGKEAIAWMRMVSKEQMTGVKGYCLRTCRLAWGLTSDQPSAIKEWESIPAKDKHTQWWTAPVGAPHFWRGGKYGHVALQANIKGLVYTTDAPVSDKVGRVTIGYFKKHWNYQYLGWADSFQNKNIPLPNKTVPVKKKVKK